MILFIYLFILERNTESSLCLYLLNSVGDCILEKFKYPDEIDVKIIGTKET